MPFLRPGLWDTPAILVKRDVLTVYGQGTATIRFRADNPGIQLFHCHTGVARRQRHDWVTFIEAPTELVAQKLQHTCPPPMSATAMVSHGKETPPATLRTGLI